MNSTRFTTPETSPRRSLLGCLILGACAAVGGCGGTEAITPRGGRGPGGEARVVAVAAASDLKYALDEIAGDFRRSNPEVSLKIAYGSSGNFFAQLSNRAPFDIYFSADIDYPRKLIAAGLALKETEFSYAIGRIVVWVPAGSGLDVERLGIESLVDPSVRKIAIANPKHAPYGRAAVAAMRNLGVYERAEGRLVLGENISQTAQFVETGAADIGIIALSSAVSPAMKGKGRFWAVPLDAYPRLEQGGVVLSWARDKDAAMRLRDSVTRGEGRAVLKKYGFNLPGE